LVVASDSYIVGEEADSPKDCAVTVVSSGFSSNVFFGRIFALALTTFGDSKEASFS
jgi:hypothetical protein